MTSGGLVPTTRSLSGYLQEDTYKRYSCSQLAGTQNHGISGNKTGCIRPSQSDEPRLHKASAFRENVKLRTCLCSSSFCRRRCSRSSPATRGAVTSACPLDCETWKLSECHFSSSSFAHVQIVCSRNVYHVRNILRLCSQVVACCGRAHCQRQSSSTKSPISILAASRKVWCLIQEYERQGRLYSVHDNEEPCQTGTV